MYITGWNVDRHLTLKETMAMKKYALVSSQGTACAETILFENEYTPEGRARIERQFCNGTNDAPITGTWRDVSENEAL